MTLLDRAGEKVAAARLQGVIEPVDAGATEALPAPDADWMWSIVVPLHDRPHGR